MIVLYSTGCPRCKDLKNILKAYSIEYVEENNIEKMLEVGINEVPVLGVDNQLMKYSKAVEWIEKSYGGKNEEQ